MEVPEIQLLSFKSIEETDAKVGGSGMMKRTTCNPVWTDYIGLRNDRGGFNKSVDGSFIDENGKRYSRNMQRYMQKNKATPLGTEVVKEYRNAYKNRFLYQQKNGQKIKTEADIGTKVLSLPKPRKLVKDVTVDDVYDCCGSCGHVTVVAALRHINPELEIDVAELVETYTTGISRNGKKFTTDDYIEKEAIENILRRADSPIRAHVAIEDKVRTRSESGPGTRLKWKQVKRTFNTLKKEKTKGKIRGALVTFSNYASIYEKEKGLIQDVSHGTYVGFEDDGSYSTWNSMTGLLNDW